MAKTQRKIVTLLTDFGTADPYVGAMKGVLLGTPDVEIVDICHEVPAHGIAAAAFVLAHAAPYFPPGTVHVVVVDPGVGSERRILAGVFGEHTYLFPDNGVITYVAQSLPLRALAIVRNSRYIPGGASATFHGRDIFAPVAGHLLAGVPPRDLGPQPDRYKLLDIPEPAHGEGSILGAVLYVDRFGNLITNIARDMLLARNWDPARLRVLCAGRDAGMLQGTYCGVPSGAPLALVNSMRLIEVAVNGGRACDVFNASPGTPVEVRP